MTRYNKILITGATGFVGQHLINYIQQNSDVEIVAVGRRPSYIFNALPQKLTYISLDLLDLEAVKSVLVTEKPDAIFHLASDSSVAYSWKEPYKCYLNNTYIFLNLLEAIQVSKIKCRVLSVGSSEQYGIVQYELCPIFEDFYLRPNSPYAVARVSQEQLSEVFVKNYGLDIVLTRSFNHVGPGQRSDFFIPSIALQLVETKFSTCKGNCEIKVGNLNAVRDYIDVRDVVRAYWMLLFDGVSGQVYNVCSGLGQNLQHVLEELISISELSVEVVNDPTRIRPVDNPVIIGSNQKIKNATNWIPEISFSTSLNDVYKYTLENLVKRN